MQSTSYRHTRKLQGVAKRRIIGWCLRNAWSSKAVAAVECHWISSNSPLDVESSYYTQESRQAFIICEWNGTLRRIRHKRQSRQSAHFASLLSSNARVLSRKKNQKVQESLNACLDYEQQITRWLPIIAGRRPIAAEQSSVDCNPRIVCSRKYRTY